MKFVKRISLFFIYTTTIFGMGFIANMAIMEFFYPGEDICEEVKEEESPIQVSVREEPVINADTVYMVHWYNVKTGETNIQEETAPDKFMGMTREKVITEIESYNQNPSLKDLEMGFTYMELLSFSSERTVVRKSYEPVEEKGFFLLNENHLVVVYDHKLEYVYLTTDILVESLPEHIQEEIIHMKYIETERELFNFLESYSS